MLAEIKILKSEISSEKLPHDSPRLGDSVLYSWSEAVGGPWGYAARGLVGDVEFWHTTPILQTPAHNTSPRNLYVAEVVAGGGHLGGRGRCGGEGVGTWETHYVGGDQNSAEQDIQCKAVRRQPAPWLLATTARGAWRGWAGRRVVGVEGGWAEVEALWACWVLTRLTPCEHQFTLTASTPYRGGRPASRESGGGRGWNSERI